MTTSIKSDGFIQSLNSSINKNNIFYTQIDSSLSNKNMYFNDVFSQRANAIINREINIKSHTSILDYILEQNLSSSTSVSFSKLRKFQPRKFNTTSKTIHDDVVNFKMAVVEKFKSNIASEELEFGIIGKTTKDTKEFLVINKDYTVNAITQYAIDNFENANIVYSVLHTLAHLDYNLIEPAGVTFAITAALHPSLEIKDFAIQCFDMWESKKSLDYLKIIEIESLWLNDYLQEVIANIESIHD